jgi:D-alanyl-D-alanine carboxypeptidase
VALAAGAFADDLPPGTRSVLTRESVPESSVSIVVRDAASNNTLLQLNGAMPRSPASTMKLLPTWAALDLLGTRLRLEDARLDRRASGQGRIEGEPVLAGRR